MRQAGALRLPLIFANTARADRNSYFSANAQQKYSGHKNNIGLDQGRQYKDGKGYLMQS